MKILAFILLCMCIGIGLVTLGNAEKDWTGVYDKGYQAGHRHGFNDAWTAYHDQKAQFSILINKYGSMKDVPWDEFNIDQKALLCAYGSPGNKMSAKDIAEWTAKHGQKEE